MTQQELLNKRIYVAGHQGMVGSAVVRKLQALGANQIITQNRGSLDLGNQAAVVDFFEEQSPEVVICAAARVGGIHANKTYPAEFIYENLIIAANTIHSAYQTGVERFLFLGSTCIYPRLAPQPMPEGCLMSGPLEETNEAYALAKILGLKLCQHYRSQYGVLFHSAMPTNLYGPGDNYHPENSHVLPALVRRIHEAKLNNDDQVTVWGTGRPRREFLHVNDLADALIHLLSLDDPPDLVNIGFGEDISIRELAEMIADIVGFEGNIVQDESRPDGTPVKLADSSLIRSTGWQPRIDLRTGIEQTYQAFLTETLGQVPSPQ